MNTELHSSFKLRLFVALMVIVLIVSFMPMQEAYAASSTKAYKSVRTDYLTEGESWVPTSSETPAACQGLYFWTENIELSDGMYYKLYCSKNSDGTNPVCIIDTTLLQKEHILDGPGYYPPQSFDKFILTNGTWIYFIMHDSFDDTARLYKVKYNSTKPVYITDLPDESGYTYLISLYGNRIYFQNEYTDELIRVIRDLCSVSLSNNKISTHRSDAQVFSVGSGSSARYIYYKGCNYDKSSYNKAYVYDCKEKTAVNLGTTDAHRISKGKLYYAKANSTKTNGGYKIYKTGISGRGTKTLVVNLKKADSVGMISSTYVYWAKRNTDTYDNIYYRYNIKTKESKKISEQSYKYA